MTYYIIAYAFGIMTGFFLVLASDWIKQEMRPINETEDRVDALGAHAEANGVLLAPRDYAAIFPDKDPEKLMEGVPYPN